METFFAGYFDEVPVRQFLFRICWCRWEGLENILVGADTGGFEGFRGQLLVLVGDHVDAEGEFIDVGAFAAQIENADFGIGDTAVEAGLGIWLKRDLELAMMLNINSRCLCEACETGIMFRPQKAHRAKIQRLRSPCSCSSDNILLDDVPFG